MLRRAAGTEVREEETGLGLAGHRHCHASRDTAAEDDEGVLGLAGNHSEIPANLAFSVHP